MGQLADSFKTAMASSIKPTDLAISHPLETFIGPKFKYTTVYFSFFSGKGLVTGMLKTGKKGLYIFDRDGQHYQVSPPCILDFYVHESRQRSGLGKQLFEHMLKVSM